MFFYPVLDALSDGRVIRRVVQGILKVSAWLMALMGILAVIGILKESFRAQESLPTVGGILFAIIVVASIACVFQIYYYRSRSIGELGQSEYTVIPIVSILCRLTGEVLATTFVSFAIGLCVMSWLGAPTTTPFAGGFGPTPMWRSENNFVMGLSFLGWFLFTAFAIILFFYFLAEAVIVLTDIARHIRRLAAGAPPEPVRSAAAHRPTGLGPGRTVPATTAAPPRAAASANPVAAHDPAGPSAPELANVGAPTAKATPSRCRSCGAKNESGSLFCAECGAEL